jgi:5-methylcytosine-specific restriction endonuclease McrA
MKVNNNKRKYNSKIRKKLNKLFGKKKAQELEVDHIKPLADGGKDTKKNIQLLTKKEHLEKTTMENKKRNKLKNRKS